MRPPSQYFNTPGQPPCRHLNIFNVFKFGSLHKAYMEVKCPTRVIAELLRANGAQRSTMDKIIW